MSSDTIVAPATPLGVGALAVIRLSGPETLKVLTRLFPEQNIQRQPGYTLKLLWLKDEENRPVDQIMLALFRQPRSYTGEDMAEITCHGGPLIVEKIIKLCRRYGCRLAEPGEFTRRAVLAGKLTLSQAEALLGIVSARTEPAHRLAIAAYQGATDRFVAEIVERLQNLYTYAEYLLGFDEGEEENTHHRLHQQTKKLLNLLDRVVKQAEHNRFLFEPARVAIIGRPNVGKSSLFNRLIGEERVITSPIPGTTRDRIEATITIGNLLITITDTCGFDPNTRNQLARLGTEQTTRAINSADLLLVVFDGSQPLHPLDREILARVQEKTKIYIINKSDLPRRFPVINFNPRAISSSCKTGKNIDRIRQTIKRHLAHSASTCPVTTLRQVEILKNCRAALCASLTAPDLEASAAELREALASLAVFEKPLTGEEILDRIFNRFCIGK